MSKLQDQPPEPPACDLETNTEEGTNERQKEVSTSEALLIDGSSLQSLGIDKDMASSRTKDLQIGVEVIT